MRVIATAGHVDHGKSTLVQALTGINPDRLQEEQERQLTIDLGFAWLTLPDGETVGIVDVPGHEDFIENMLAGVGGIDAGMLIIAADEGVMPQTREHLAILDLLQIPRLMVVLTKIDTISDPEWRDLVILDIEEVLGETRFPDAPIVPVSAVKGDGLDALLDVLDDVLGSLEPQTPDGIPRLPVDRVFTMSGFGTIVTGTLLDGALKVGDTVEIAPRSITGRIRNLQSHNEDVQVAVPGSRVAVNISGVDKDDIQRGNVITLPDVIHPTTLIDVELEYLATAPRPLKHNAEIKLFAGPSESLGRVRLLLGETVAPGETTFAQIQLYDDLPLINRQRFIIRYPSPPATVGGGLILDTAPGRKWKRSREDVVARFERLASGTPLDLISAALIQARRPMTRDEIERKTGLSLADVELTYSIVRQDKWFAHEETLHTYHESITHLLENFHRDNPLLAGMPVQRLANKLRLEEAHLETVLAMLGDAFTMRQGKFLSLPDFQVTYTRAQQAGIEKLERAFAANPYTPPSVKEAVEMLGSSDVLDALVSQGELVRLGADVLLAPNVYREWALWTRDKLAADGEVRLGDLRDTFNTTRKYALPFLDHLASLHLTRLVGDVHKPGRGDWAMFVG